MTASVEIVDVTHRFGDLKALSSVSLLLEAGTFAVLLGPSGCGKTTLLSVLGGFLDPSEGRVLIGGKDVTHVPPAKRPTTTMFQDYALFPHMTTGANIAFGLRMRGIGREQRDERAGELLALVGLPDAFSKKPHELSGGQRQRVALARALAVDPDVLLLDEPLGALDLKLRRQMQVELKAIQRRIGTTFVHVTHDQEEAMAIADRIIVMNSGRIVDEGTPEDVYLRPRRRFSAAFMGEANFVPGRVVTAEGEQLSIETPLGRLGLPTRGRWETGDRVLLGMRPEHVTSGEAPAGSVQLGPGVVRETAFFGTHHRCRVALERLGCNLIIAHLPQAATINEGMAITLHIDPERILLVKDEDDG